MFASLPKILRKVAVARRLTRLHRNEGGMEALQIVVILAVAALVMLMLNVWVGTATDTGSTTIGGWVNDQLTNIFALDFSGGAGGGVDPDQIELEQ